MPTSNIRWSTAAALSLVTLLAACSHTTQLRSARRGATTTTTTSDPSTTTTETSTTTVPATTTTKPLPGLGVGARGAQVMALEQRLNELRYDVGKVDGVFDTTTAYAVTAFQKVTGRSRTGRATDDVVAALPSATLPAALVPGGGANRVEIDLKRQVLFLYEGNALAKILPVSTGSGERFCVDGRCERAITPGGSFRIYRRAKGWETSPLGRLYNSQYFNAGIAIHGSPSVPPYPASHGCVRIPMSAAEWFPDHVFYGTPVYVFGGPIAPAPFADVPPVPGTTPEPPPTTVPVTTAPRPTTPSTLLVPLTVARATTTTTTAVRAPTTTSTASRR